MNKQLQSICLLLIIGFFTPSGMSFAVNQTFLEDTSNESTLLTGSDNATDNSMQLPGFCGGDGYDLMATDFNYSDPVFKDTQKDKDILALQADEVNQKSVSGMSSINFTGESCHYDLTLHCVGENTAKSTYELFIAGESMGVFRPAMSLDEFEFSDRYNATFKTLKINLGDEIKLKATNGSLDGAWSGARWYKMELKPVHCTTDDTWIEENGVLIIEAEDVVTLPTVWKRNTGYGSLGSGYLVYSGSNSMSSPAANSIMTYKIKITNPGTYLFKWWSRNGAGAEAVDQENDSWLKIKGDDFYGLSGGEKVPCKDHFIKVWIHSMNEWSSNSKGEHAGKNGFNVFAVFNSPGEYEINVAGRSKGHPIDRMMLYKSSNSAKALSRSASASTKGCDFGDGGIIIDPDTINAIAGPFKEWNIPGKIEGIYFDLGGEGKSYHDENIGWEGGLTFNQNPRYTRGGLEDVEIESNNIVYAEEGEWLNYTIKNTEDGVYDIELLVSTVAYGGLRLLLNGQDLGNIEARSTGSWTKYRTYTIKDVSLVDVPDGVPMKVQFERTVGTYKYLLNLREIRFVKQTTGVEDVDLAGIQAYPNPVSDKVIMQNISKVSLLNIYRADGKLIFSKSISNDSEMIDMVDYASGFYLVECVGRSGKRKLIKLIKY